MTNVPLQLRDIHLPPPISWWPLAPGWYLVIAILAVALIILARRYRQRRQWQLRLKQTQTYLKKLQAMGPAVPISHLSMFLKRVALSYYPREAVAHLHGEQWLAFLDKTGATSAFTRGAGQILVDGNYPPTPPPYDRAELFEIMHLWIQRQESQ